MVRQFGQGPKNYLSAHKSHREKPSALIMQMTYRATRKHQPQKSDTLVSSREQAFALIESLDKKLATRKISRQERATYLCGRAVLYEALGDRKMLDAAKEAYAFSKTAQSAALVAVALHHYGRIRESLDWYDRAYAYPHEPGYEIDIGKEGALLFRGTAESWLEAWKIVKQLKKRICYAAYLPTWDGGPVKELQILSEGGYGDLIQDCRYLPLLAARGVQKATVYLPPYFFENGFVDLARHQEWWPETKLLTECRAGVPSAGFFDLPAIWQTTPETLPPAPVWSAGKIPLKGYLRRPRVGLCWAARAMETPICSEDVYRAMSRETAEQIVRKTDPGIHWISLQKGESIAGVEATELKSWVDTAKLISTLDAVVTVDTANAHLAASLGVPTWVILSGAIDWKWGLEGETSIWYDKIRLFRNEDFGFQNSVAKVIAAINNGELSFQQRTMI